MAGFLASTIRAANASFPGLGFGDLRLKARFVQAAFAHRASAVSLLDPTPGSNLADAMRERPQMAGILLWPYQCAGWGPDARIARFVAHYDAAAALGPPWRFGLHEKLILSDLADEFAGLRLVIDQPKWLMREGGLAVNLFVDDFRAYSLAFSLFRTGEERLQAVIGGLQGRKTNESLGLYRDLTKALYGLRPRDFLIDVLRMICRAIEVDQIAAVTQAHRHHQHPFFGKKDLTPDYDAIWEERGGIKQDEMFYFLQVTQARREIEAIKANKRSLYRKRYAFMDRLDAQIAKDLPHLSPTTFVDL